MSVKLSCERIKPKKAVRERQVKETEKKKKMISINRVGDGQVQHRKATKQREKER